MVTGIVLGILLLVAALLVYAMRGPAAGPLPDPFEAAPASPDRLREAVRVLSEEFHPRDWQNGKNLDLAAAWIFEQLRATGFTTTVETYTARDRLFRNVVARRAGTDPNAGAVILGAHYDACGATPGADDDASGIAVLLELGRTLPADPGRHPLVLVAFSTEEPPFFLSKDMGSYRFADAWKARGEKLDLMVALDLVGFFTDEPASQGFPVPGMGLLYPRTGNFIAMVGDLRSGRSIRTVKRGMLAARALPVESFRAPGLVPGVLWSDHLSFRRKGFPAVLVTDTAFLRYEHYHAPSDTAEKLDYNRMAAVVRCLHGIVREADGAEP